MSSLAIAVDARDHATGPITAPFVLLEYGDFECPHCQTAYPVLRALREERAFTLVYRHFPLTNVHPHAQRAAETAEWAAQHGRFWDMHDHLFEHKRLDERGLLAAARELGLDAKALQHAWDTHAMIAAVKAQFLGGIESGVTATPKLFINGHRHDGRTTREALIPLLT